MTGKKQANPRDRKVAKALYQRALGMTLKESRTEITDKGAKTVTTEKQLPPDISAQMFWLKNRCPEEWRDKIPEKREEGPDNLLEVLEKSACNTEP